MDTKPLVRLRALVFVLAFVLPRPLWLAEPARPAAAIVARRLREQGARDLPRGPRPSTLQNQAKLTSREVEILTLIATGIGNAEIAAQLFLSKKTVDHHVSAILRKLGVKTRGQAAAQVK